MNFTTNAIYLCLNSEMTSVACGMDLGVLWADGVNYAAIFPYCHNLSHQDELDDTAQTWNAHTIRPSRNTNVPSGRPNIMYAIPQLYNRDYLCPVQSEHLGVCKTECIFREPIPCDRDVYSLCNDIMVESHLHLPEDPYQAVNLYMHLRGVITTALQMLPTVFTHPLPYHWTHL